MFTIRALAVYGTVVTVAIGGLVVASRPHVASSWLGLPAYPWVNWLFFGGLAIAFVALSAVAVGLLQRLLRLGRRISGRALARSTQGTIVVEFAMVLPIILVVVGTVIQIALLANASLVVRYSAFAAARSAIVRFEYKSVVAYTDELLIEPAKVDQAARLILASISPRLNGNEDAAARAIHRIHEAQGGPWGSRSFVDRMSYAVAASRITTVDRTPQLALTGEEFTPPYYQRIGNWVGFDVSGMVIPFDIPSVIAPREVIVSVEYDFLLTIPGLSMIPLLTRDPPNGVAGHCFTIRQSVRLQSVGARQSGLGSMLPFEGNSPSL